MEISRRKFIKAGSLAAANLTLVSTAGKAEVLNDLFHAAIYSPGCNELEKGFLSPPDTARPSCYWWWFNGLVDKEGITRDLEEFRRKGMGSVFMVNTAGGLGGVQMPFGAKFLSDEWKELFRYALQEANRLDLEVGFNLCAGWCMGGPWITPENAGRWFLQSELSVTGPRRFSGRLPLPGNRDGYDNVFNPPGYKEYIDLPLEKLDYRDTAIVAFPEPDMPGSKISDERLSLLPAKTNRKDASNFATAVSVMKPALQYWSPSPSDKPVAVSQVIDLTPGMRSDGHLDWEVPEGRWTIVRTGHRMTGSKLMIAPPEADGLSVGWLNSEGLEQQFRHLGKVLLDVAGPLAEKTLKYFADDSFEDGFPNWTDKILEKFEYYRGYDPRPYLPVFSGRIIGNAEVSDRFLHDYRKTVADCMADAHYKRFAELCHENNLLVQNEAAGPSRSGTMCMDGLKNLGRSDRPMGEFWLGGRHDEEGGLDDKLGYGMTRLEKGQNKVTKMVASAAHIYGKKLVSAESYTSYRHWLDYPGSLKQATDRAFCEGVNRIVIHTSTASRPRDGKPGYEYGAGTHFNPNVTWWDKSGGFLEYIGRCQHLLQSGLFVADVLYYNGDWAPNLVEPKHADPSLGKGYDYDVCNEEVLLTRLSVQNGRIVLPDGMSYRVLVLPDTARMPVPVIKKIEELVKKGAVIAGPKPESDPGLKNYPDCDTEVKKLAAKVWGNCDGKRVKLNHYGKGTVFHGVSLRSILQDRGILPDFEVSGKAEKIDFIHRSADGMDIYFVTNLTNSREACDCVFRAAGTQPEIWDAVTGEIRKAEAFRAESGRIAVPMEFYPFQSFFIIFRKNKVLTNPVKSGTAERNFPMAVPVMEITGSWKVKFDPQWGGPAEAEFEELGDWSKRPEAGIKYYSGTATYLKQFDLDQDVLQKKLYLDLGTVKNIAEVRLNGKKAGVVWTSPWRAEITGLVKPEGNRLEIDVVNLWPNRLIGDAALPAEKRFTNTNIPFKKDMPLLPSGLLGPVTVQTAS